MSSDDRGGAGRHPAAPAPPAAGTSPRTMLTTLLFYAIFAAAAVGGLKLAVTFMEPRMAFFPFPGETVTPRDLGIPYREIALTTADGERLVAWRLEHDDPAAEVVFFHGNGGNLSVWLEPLAAIWRQGLTVLAVDYRGFGRSTGTPSEAGLYRDADAVLAEVDRLREPGRPLVYWGRSLGATVAAYAASVAPPDGLILEAPFPDKNSLLRHYPVLRVLAVFSRYRFPTVEFLEGFDRPVLVLHGDRDSIVPIRQGRAVYEALETPARRFVTLEGVDHNDLVPDADPVYWPAILEFVEELAGAGGGRMEAASARTSR